MAETPSESYFTCPKCGSEDYSVGLTRHGVYTFKSGRLAEIEDSFPGCAFMTVECSRCRHEEEESLNHDELLTFLRYVERDHDMEVKK